MANEKLRNRMLASKSGWGWKDLDRLYASYGFVRREGGKHSVYWHPDHPGLAATVARHRSLPAGYVRTALKLIGRLEQLSQGRSP